MPKSQNGKKHMARVAELGCIVCRNTGYGYSIAEVHHIREGAGMGKRASNFDTIPLCPNHHRNGGHGIAFHAGKRTWQELYGTESELLEQVKGLLNGG